MKQQAACVSYGQKGEVQEKKTDVLEQTVPAKHKAKCGTQTYYSPTGSKPTEEAHACQHFDL